MKRYIIVLISLFILNGCDVKYNLSYKDNIFTEDLTINNYTVEDDFLFLIEHYANDPIYSDVNDKVLTSKKISKKTDNVYNLEFKSIYENEPYENSVAFSECFQYHTFNETDDKLYISVYGDYYCDEFEELQVVFNTDKKINFSNAHDSYSTRLIWNFNKEDKIDIELEIDKNINIINYKLIIILITIVLMIIVISVVIYKVLLIRKREMKV